MAGDRRSPPHLVPWPRLATALALTLILGGAALVPDGCARVKTVVGTVGDGSVESPGTGGGGTGGTGLVATGGNGVIGTGGVAWMPGLAPEWNCGTNCYADPTLPASPPPADRFTGTADLTATNKPSLVYPLPGSMHPINLADIAFQWMRGSGASQQLFRIHLEGATVPAPSRYDFYVVCRSPPVSPPPPQEACFYDLPPGAWLAVAAANRGGTVKITISATDGGGGPVASADSQSIAFSPEPVLGGLYYWSVRLQGTRRLLFGARKSLPFIVPGSAANPTSCGGCHAVSRDGRVIAFSAGAVAANAYLRVAPTVDPGTPTFQPSGAHDSATIALSPDGAWALVSYASKLELRRTADGSVAGTVSPDFLGSERQGYHPDWSPDGKQIAVTLSAVPDSQWAVRTGQIAVLPFNNGAFGPATVVAPAGADFHFYPSWSPDGKWIAFASAPAGMNLISYDQAQARLRLVSRDGGTLYELAKATVAVGKYSSWPKFAPFVQAGGNIMFITFNSKMDYGLLLPNSLVPKFGEQGAGLAQLWMAAIDLRALASGDPSLPPVWLPFQDLLEQNHLGFWTEQVGCREGADGGASIGCGEGESCRGGHCVTDIY